VIVSGPDAAGEEEVKGATMSGKELRERLQKARGEGDLDALSRLVYELHDEAKQAREETAALRQELHTARMDGDRGRQRVAALEAEVDALRQRAAGAAGNAARAEGALAAWRENPLGLKVGETLNLRVPGWFTEGGDGLRDCLARSAGGFRDHLVGYYAGISPDLVGWIRGLTDDQIAYLLHLGFSEDRLLETLMDTPRERRREHGR
jgi:hypothetical protein